LRLKSINVIGEKSVVVGEGTVGKLISAIKNLHKELSIEMLAADEPFIFY